MKSFKLLIIRQHVKFILFLYFTKSMNKAMFLTGDYCDYQLPFIMEILNNDKELTVQTLF